MKNKRLLVVCMFNALLTFLCYGQDFSGKYNKPEIIPPSPTAQIFEEYGNIPVSLYSGIPDIKIPLFVVKVGKLALPVYLSYNSSGVRVDEMPGIVGMKWCLNYGGMISRSIYGIADDSGNGWLKTSKLSGDPDLGDPQIRNMLRDISYGCKDGQPDEYYVTTPTINSKFVFDYKNQAATIPYRNIKIENDLNLNSWIIRDEAGNSYSFHTSETVLKTSSCDYSESGIPFCSHDGFSKSGWMLDAIKSADSADSIRIEYDGSFKSKVIRKLVSEEFLFNPPSFFNFVDPPYWRNRCYESYTYDLKIPRYIKTRDQTIEFIASSYSNPDYGAKIDAIHIYDCKNNKIKSFLFEYISISQDNRPALKKVTEVAADGIQNNPYEFFYNAIILPNWSSLAVDEFGFYNGRTSSTSLISENSRFYALYHNIYQNASDKSIDNVYNQAGMLTKIKYPTGGFTCFNYESNRIFSHLLLHYTPRIKIFSPVTENGIGVYEDTLIITPNDIDVSVRSVFLSNYSNNEQLKPYFTITNPSGNIIRTFLNSSSELVRLNLDAGTYTVKFHLRDERDFGTIGFKITREIRIQDQEINSGGLRIANISNYTEEGNLASSKTFRYNKFGSNITSGQNTFQRMHYEYMTRIIYNYPSVSSVSRSNIGLTRGSYVGYSDVTEITTDSGNKFVTCHKFSSNETFPDKLNGDIVLYTPNDSRDYKRGLELWRREYDKDNVLVRKVERNYTFNGENLGTVNHSNVISGIKVTREKISQDGIPYYNWESYDNLSEWFYLSSETETEYIGADSIMNAKHFFYENSAHSQLTKETQINSDDEIIENSFYYPLDYPTLTEMDNMDFDNMERINLQAKIKIIKKAGQKIVDGIITNYNQNFQPQSIFRLEKAEYNPVTHFDRYDHYGNLLQYRGIDNINNSFIWGYDNTLPVVSIENLAFNDIPASIKNNIGNYQFSRSLHTVDIQNDIAFLKTQLASLLANQNCMVTFYTYKPLVGMTSQTDPSGRTIFYEYDSFGRLQYVRDLNEKIIEQYDHHYRNQ